MIEHTYETGEELSITEGSRGVVVGVIGTRREVLEEIARMLRNDYPGSEFTNVFQLQDGRWKVNGRVDAEEGPETR